MILCCKKQHYPYTQKKSHHIKGFSMQTPISQTSPQAIPQTAPEHILVVKRDILFAETPAWHGLKNVDIDAYLSLI